MIAVFDESGKTSSPGPGDADFAVAAILFEEALLPAIDATAVKIRDAVGGRFKYKHVSKCEKARKLLLQFLGSHSKEVKVFGVYFGGNSIFAEDERQRLGAARYGNEMQLPKPLDQTQNPHRTALRQIFQWIPGCLANYGKYQGTVVECYWDDRTDLDVVANAWNCSLDRFERTVWKGLIRHAPFRGEVLQKYKEAAHLADVLAGDIRRFFREFGEAIWSSMPDESVEHSDPYLAALRDGQIHGMSGAIARHVELGHNDFWAPNNTLIRGYWRNFPLGLLSFVSPLGIAGHLHVEHTSAISIRRLAD